MSTLIAEDLLLLLLDDEKGTLAASDKIQPLLGGAMMTELALAERVTVTGRSGLWGTAKVVAVPGPAPADPLLAQALAVVERKPRTAVDLVTRLGKGVKDELLDRLEQRGLVHGVRGRVLGLFPRTTWPATDRRHEDAVRERLHGVLVLGLEPDPRTAALVALLGSVDQAHRVVDRGDLPARLVKRRAKDVAEGEWAARAVVQAIASAQAAVVAAVAASTTAATGGG